LLVSAFHVFLQQRLAVDPPKQKGQRTRARLVAAAAKGLEDKGYHALRISDITAEAELAEGSFYVYFKDKTEIAVEALTLFFEDYVDQTMRPVADATAFDRIRTSNRQWIAVCRANPGMMRCALQVGDYVPEFAVVAQRTGRRWYEIVASSVQRRRSVPGGGDIALLTSYLLASMADEMARKLIVMPDEGFLELLDRLGGGDETLADSISVVWHRLIYGDVPAAADLSPAVADLSRFLAGATERAGA